MKRLMTATCAAALCASNATAGGMAEPVEMAPVEIIEDAAGSAASSGGLIVPLILIALIAAAVGSGDDEIVRSAEISDMRVKEGINPVGTSPSGLNLYEFSYIGSADRYVGVMAQEVLLHTPDAVITHPSGVLAVDYSLIDVEFQLVD